MIDGGGRNGDTAGMVGMNPEPRKFQFTLRKLLLWTVVVALGLCVLSPLQPWVIIVVLTWFTVIFIMQWAFGSKWAAVISVLMVELPFGWLFCCEWITGDRGFETVEVAFSGAILRGVIGFGSFLLVEVAWQAVNWIDRIGQADGKPIARD